MATIASGVLSVFVSLKNGSEHPKHFEILLGSTSKSSIVEANFLRVGSLDSVLGAVEDVVLLEANSLNFFKKLIEVSSQLIGWDSELRAPLQDIHGPQYELDALLTPLNLGVGPNLPFEDVNKIVNTLAKSLEVSEKRFHSKLSTYLQLRERMTACEAKIDDLVVRSLDALISKDAFVKGSEYLQTLLVFVPTENLEQWYSCYERLASCVVPRSSETIVALPKGTLVSVTIFKRGIGALQEAFSSKPFEIKVLDCSQIVSPRNRQDELDFLVREEQRARQELVSLVISESRQRVRGQMIITCLRIFLESILRFGLPQEFTCYSLAIDNEFGIQALKEFIARQFQPVDAVVPGHPSSEDGKLQSFTLMGPATLVSVFSPY